MSPHLSSTDWRTELPVLTGRLLTLREPQARDVPALAELLSLADAPRFGLDAPPSENTMHRWLDRVARERAAGQAFCYAITQTASRGVVGLVRVRQLDPEFDSAEWEGTLAPAARGGGAFLEAARLVGSFTFGLIGAHRLEARVPIEHGRANGALRKLGAVQEGLLRRATRRGDGYGDQALWSLMRDDWGDYWVSTAPRVH